MQKTFTVCLILLLTPSAFCATLFDAAGIKLSEGKFEEAARAYEDFTQLNRNHYLAPTALFNAANIRYSDLGDKKSAVERYMRLVSEYSGTKWAAESYRRLAEIAAENEEHNLAVDYYLAGLKNSSGEDFTMSEDWINRMASGCAEAIDQLESGISRIAAYEKIVEYLPQGDSQTRVMFNLGEAYEEAGFTEKAAEIYRSILETNPLHNSSEQILNSKRDIVGEDFPYTAVEALKVVFATFNRGGYQEAKEGCERILQDYADTPFTMFAEYGIIVCDMFNLGDFETGIDRLRDYVDQYPQCIAVQDAGRMIEFCADVLRLKDDIAEDSENYGAHIELGFLFLRSRLNNFAIEHFTIAAEGCDEANAYYGLGYAYQRSGQVEKSVESFEIYLQKEPESGDVRNIVGYAYLGMERYDEALKCFDKYVEFEPENSNAYDSRSECYFRMGRIEEAVAGYKQAIEMDPEFSNPYFMLGEIHRETGDKAQAIECYEQFLNLQPQGGLSDQARAHIEELSKQ